MLPERTSPEFPAALKARREFLGLSRRELAEQAGICSTGPRRYEEPTAKHFSAPSPKTWRVLNIILGYDLNKHSDVCLSDATLDQLFDEIRKRINKEQ